MEADVEMLAVGVAEIVKFGDALAEALTPMVLEGVVEAVWLAEGVKDAVMLFEAVELTVAVGV